MKFNDAVRSFRQELGITQAELAKALHINEITVRRWELGKNRPGRTVSDALTDYAGKSGASAACIKQLRLAAADAVKERLKQKSGQFEITPNIGMTPEIITDMLNDTPSGIAVIEADPDDIESTLRTVFYNDRFFSYSGYTRKEYAKKLKNNDMALVYKEDIPKLLASTVEMCTGSIGSSADCTVRCHTKGGGFRWLLLTGQLVRRRGSICVIYISVMDITQRQEAVERLRINEEMLRIAAETDKRAMVVYDIRKNACRIESRTLFSAKYGDVIENIPESLIERAITAPECADELRSLFTRIRNGEREFKVSLKMCSGIGKYEWFECSVATIFDDSHMPLQAVLVFHNITDQRIKEAVFKKWKQSIDTRAFDSFTLFRCNLSNNCSIDEQDGGLLKITFASDNLSFNERTRLYAKDYVHPEDWEAYTALLDSDTLLAMFYRGEHSASLDYRETDAAGGEKWRRLTVETVEYLDSSDIQAFLMYEDIDEAKKAEIETRLIAESDPLTGALNRAAFVRKADEIISADPEMRNALIMLDMDGFKQLNDTFGHSAGDQALQEVVNVLRSYARSGDLVCRLGGDEFLVWLHDTPYDAVIARTAQQMCDHIRKAYSKEVLLSASVGIAVYPRDGHCFDELYPNADKALYSVKNARKGVYAFFSSAGADNNTSESEQALSTVNRAPLSPQGTKRRILIVDDNEISVSMLKNIFKDEYLIETAHNGAEAMIRLRHFGMSISVVLLDLLMPGVDGFDVLGKMQRDTVLRTIPAIVVTGDGERDTLLKVLELGAAEFVTKPVDVDIIRMRVHSVICKAENERLRAQNSYLTLQRNEEAKYRTVLESTGTVVVEYDWHNHIFTYDSEISKYIAGNYDHHGMWRVFLSDMVADSADVKAMQDLLIDLAGNRLINRQSKLIRLKTPKGAKHWFRMNIYKTENEFGLAEKMILTFNDVNEEVLSNEKLLFQATRDPLTGLYNRAGFIDEAAKLIAAREPGYYVMSCIDIEKFKIINDQFGTERGDDILRRFAQTLEKLHHGEKGICCRITADNFAILYPARLIGSQELEQSHELMEHIDDSLPMIRFAAGRCLVDDKTLDVSAVYDRAAMAKDTIKGRYDKRIATFDESMRTNLLRQQKITGQMKHALESDQFEVWLQPQFNHSTGLLSGAEALVRWRHPAEGIIPPAEFIPVFERNGFVYEVDKYVWERTCSLLRKWLDSGFSPVPVSVNISRYDVFRDDFIDCIKSLVRKYDIPISLLRLEITETAFSESAAQIITVAQELVDAGFTVEIDDFGSGYSSLNTLKDVPAQILKLDMHFLEGDRNVRRGGSIIESVVRMAKWLGMSVIAEGVETSEQADYLKSIGCNYIQGYLYAKPMPASGFEQLCHERSIEHAPAALETVDNLDQLSFWDPGSLDTLIFNSFVGSACIIEYTSGRIEMIRATKHYTSMLGNSAISIEDVLGLDWGKYLAHQSYRRFVADITESRRTKETVYSEYEFTCLPGCTPRTVIRSGVRVIAVSGDRWLIYCISENITAQREAEEKERLATQISEQMADQMQAILDNVDVGIVASVHKDDAVEIIFANQKYYDLLGYAREQFEAELTDPLATFAESDRQRVKGIISSHIESKGSCVFEVTMQRRDGSVLLARNTLSVCRFAGIGDPVHLSIYRDITEERRLELREKRSAEEINIIMKNVNCGICAISFNGGGRPDFLFANDQFYSAAGYTKEQILREVGNVIDIIHPDDRDKFSTVLADVISLQAPVTFDFRCIRRDGSIIFLNSSISFADMTGYGRVAILVQTDITATIQSQQNISQLAKQLEVIINNAADAITAIAVGDGQPYLVFANDKHYEQLGTTKEAYASEYEGKTDFVIEEDRARVAGLLFDADSVGDRTSVEFRIRRTDGAIRWMRSNISVVSYPGIEGPVQLAATSDITEQTESARKEQRLSAELRTMMSDMPGGFVRLIKKPDGRYKATFCNEGFGRLLNIDCAALLERYADSPMEKVHPEDVDIVRQTIDDIHRNGTAHSSRYRLCRTDGSYIWVRVFGRFTKDQNGNTYLNLYFYDETDSEKHARHREMLMDNLPMGAGAYSFRDGKMSLIYQNKRFWEMMGLDGNTSPDPSPMSAIHPDDKPVIMQKLAEAIKQHGDVECDIRLRHLNLGYRPTRLTACIVPDEAGSILILATFVLIE